MVVLLQTEVFENTQRLPSQTAESWNFCWDLRIGSAFLKNFAVTLDYRHGQITLTRAVNPQPEK